MLVENCIKWLIFFIYKIVVFFRFKFGIDICVIFFKNYCVIFKVEGVVIQYKFNVSCLIYFIVFIILFVDQLQIFVQWMQDIIIGEFGYCGSSVWIYEDKFRYWMDVLCFVVFEFRDIK